jgi:NTE family protein
VNNSLCDLLIRPDISGYSISSFTNAAADSLIGRGEKAAGEFRSQLRELKVKYHLEPTPTDRKLICPETWPVAKVTFHGNGHLDPDFLLKTMALETPGNYSAHEIQRAIQRLYGLGGLEKITFNMQDTISGKILNIHLKTRQVFTQNIGFRANTTDAAAILINMTRKNYRHIFGLLSSSAELSINPGVTLTAETHQTNLPTVGINVKGKYQNFNIYNEGKKSVEANLFYTSASLYFYQPFMRHLELGMGLQEEYFHGDIFSRHVNVGNNGKMNQFLTNAYCYLSFDNMDDFYFPAKGTNLYAEFSLIDDFKNAQKIAPVVLVKMKNVVPVNHQMALLFDGYARALLNSTFPGSRATLVGGEPYSRYFNYHLPFVGIPALSITGRYTYIALIGWRMKVSSAQYVSLLVNGLHHGSEWFSLHQNANVLGAGVRYSLKTMLGPLDMTAGYSPSTDKPTFSASFGLWF